MCVSVKFFLEFQVCSPSTESIHLTLLTLSIDWNLYRIASVITVVPIIYSNVFLNLSETPLSRSSRFP